MIGTEFWTVWARSNDEMDGEWKLVAAWPDEDTARAVAKNLSITIKRPTTICRAKTTHLPEIVNPTGYGEMKKCKYADRYKAVHPPRCGNGKPCDVCATKWGARK